MAKTTLNIKKIMLEELRAFKAREDIYAPDLQCSKQTLNYLRDAISEFTHNIARQSLLDVDIERRLMPIHINNIFAKRLDIPFIDSLLPKPRNLSLYSYKPRKLPKSSIKLNHTKSDTLIGKTPEINRVQGDINQFEPFKLLPIIDKNKIRRKIK